MNKKHKYLHVIMVSLLVSACSYKAKDLKPVDYLKDTLNTIESRALNRDKVNWKTVQKKALSMASGAKSTSDTYPAIVYALSELKDNHSFLLNQKGQMVSLEPNTRVEKPTPRVKRSGLIEKDGNVIGFLVVEGLSSNRNSTKSKNYTQFLYNQIEMINSKNPIGWIVDLRGNTGGNMWPMIAGLGPILGSGTLGYFRYKNSDVPWFYEDGKTGVINALKIKLVNFEVEKECSVGSITNPVAVLIDSATSSSGEAVTISFKGRPRTKFFGQKTCGLSTSNEQIPLIDGATLYLTTTVECDRNKVVFWDGISPDMAIAQKDLPLGDENDPVIKGAVDWLSTQ